MALQTKHLKALGLDEATAAEAQAAGVPFALIFQLLMQFGPAALKLIQDLIAAWKNPTPPAVVQAKKAVAAGCCDHVCLCKATVDACQAAYEVAAAHYCACCAE